MAQLRRLANELLADHPAPREAAGGPAAPRSIKAVGRLGSLDHAAAVV
jgi:hypothetical protein